MYLQHPQQTGSLIRVHIGPLMFVINTNTGGRTYDETMDARQCLICVTCSDWVSGCTVGNREAMLPFCAKSKAPTEGENGMLGQKQMAVDL